MTTPIYQHDCSQCVFLGASEHEGAPCDLYFCTHRLTGPTVIARFGDEGMQYTSGLLLAPHVKALGEAKLRAIERGLL